MQLTQVDEIADAVRKGEDVAIYVEGMVFAVKAVTERTIPHPDRYREYIDFLELHLDDQSETDWSNSDLLRGKPDTTGSMSLCKDPTDKLNVLADGEEPPPPTWQT